MLAALLSIIALLGQITCSITGWELPEGLNGQDSSLARVGDQLLVTR